MLHSYNDLTAYSIRAADGQSGRVDDLYFDDSDWRIRYLVAHSGFILTGRQSLLGARLLGAPDTEKREVPVSLTKDEVDSAQPPEAHPPVSEQAGSGIRASDLDAWPAFLIGTGFPYSPGLAMEQIGFDRALAAESRKAATGDPHLRSMAELRDYTVAATDGDFGSVVDFLIDPQEWRLRFVVIDTGNWLPGRRVVVTTDRVSKIDALGTRLHVEADRQAVEDAPRLRDIEDLRISDTAMAARYGAIGYWPV